MLRELFQQCLSIAHFEVSEVEAWGYSAADQSIGAWPLQAGAEPRTCRDPALQGFACRKALAEQKIFLAAVRVNYAYDQRVTGVKVPHFVGLDTVQGRELVAAEEKVDSTGSCPLAANGMYLLRGEVGLAVPSAFGMTFEPEMYDELF